MGLFRPPDPTSLRVKGNVKKLIELLFYKDPDIRYEAATQLSYLDDKSEIVVIVENLIRVLKKDQNSNVRAHAAITLKAFPHPTTIEPLVDALDDPETLYAASMALYPCLGFYGQKYEKAIEICEIKDETYLKLKTKLSDMSKKREYDNERSSIIGGLIHIPDDRIAPILKEQIDLSEKIHKKKPSMDNANVIDNCRLVYKENGSVKKYIPV